jgi:hypothetical protein
MAHKHTKEPWIVAGTALDIRTEDNQATIASIDWGDDPEVTEANARRIVACVNACRGLSTESLEKDYVVWLHTLRANGIPTPEPTPKAR